VPHSWSITKSRRLGVGSWGNSSAPNSPRDNTPDTSGVTLPLPPLHSGLRDKVHASPLGVTRAVTGVSLPKGGTGPLDRVCTLQI
jgi:hypothetical protein